MATKAGVEIGVGNISGWNPRGRRMAIEAGDSQADQLWIVLPRGEISQHGDKQNGE